VRRILLVVVAGALLSLGILPASAQSELDRARTDLADAEAAIVELQAEADAATAAFHQAESELGQIELDIDLLTTEVAAIEADVAVLETELSKMAIQQYTGVAAAGDLEEISRPDINESAVAGFLVDYATGTSTDVLDDFRAATALLENRRSALADAQQAQELTLGELTTAQDTVYASLEGVQAERDRIESVVSGLEAAERARIEAEMAAAAAAAAAATSVAPAPTTAPDAGPVPTDAAGEPADPPDAGGPQPTPAPPPPAPAPASVGPFVCPVAGPTSFVDTWGAPRGNGRTHQGVDMMAASGTPVVNPVSGVVEHRGNSLGGESFHLYGSNGNYYYGTHLSAYGAAGSLSAGTVVGYVGSTGNATTPHLHFEIHPGGQGNAVNPYPTVAQYC